MEGRRRACAENAARRVSRYPLRFGAWARPGRLLDQRPDELLPGTRGVKPVPLHTVGDRTGVRLERFVSRSGQVHVAMIARSIVRVRHPVAELHFLRGVLERAIERHLVAPKSGWCLRQLPLGPVDERAVLIERVEVNLLSVDGDAWPVPDAETSDDVRICDLQRRRKARTCDLDSDRLPLGRCSLCYGQHREKREREDAIHDCLISSAPCRGYLSRSSPALPPQKGI